MKRIQSMIATAIITAILVGSMVAVGSEAMQHSIRRSTGTLATSMVIQTGRQASNLTGR